MQPGKQGCFLCCARSYTDVMHIVAAGGDLGPRADVQSSSVGHLSGTSVRRGYGTRSSHRSQVRLPMSWTGYLALIGLALARKTRTLFMFPPCSSPVPSPLHQDKARQQCGPYLLGAPARAHSPPVLIHPNSPPTSYFLSSLTSVLMVPLYPPSSPR